MSPNEFITGKTGNNIRSDCWVRFKKKRAGGRRISVQSKVATLYGLIPPA